MSNTKWAFDTNVLICFLNKKSFFHLQAVSAFKQALTKNKKIVFTQQNIIELIQYLTQQQNFSLSKAITKATQITKLDVSIAHPQPQTLEVYFSLCNKAQSKLKKNHFDYYLAATLLSNNIHTLITNNPKDFQNIPGLKIISLKKKLPA